MHSRGVKETSRSCAHAKKIQAFCLFFQLKEKTMKFKPAVCTALAMLAVAVAAPAWPATATSEHDAHHPDGATSAPTVDASRFGMQMRTMQEMHQKMMAAKTPDERAALMSDHMKAMQDGMVMMGQMSGGMPSGEGMGMGVMKKDGATKAMKKGGPISEHDTMHRRMDMMEMMMQMMIDRQAAIPPAAK